MELEIESRNVAMTPRWKAEIEFRMGSLAQRHKDLIHGRVTLMKNRHHKKLGNVAQALVVVTLPERQTVTARKDNKTFEEAIRAAFHAVNIALRKYREKRVAVEMISELEIDTFEATKASEIAQHGQQAQRRLTAYTEP